jgi:hypothetical protein
VFDSARVWITRCGRSGSRRGRVRWSVYKILSEGVHT